MEKILLDIGLTKNEIKVYNSLLHLGECKVGKILEYSKLNSGKIYEILNSLQKKGLVSVVIKNGIKFFNPANPKRVLDYLNTKEEKIEEQKKEYNKILPDLLSKLNSAKSKPKIEIFTGIEGMKTAYRKELEFPSKEIIRVMGVPSSKNYNEEVANYFENFHRPERDRKGFFVKKILSESARNERAAHEKKAEIKYIPYGSILTVGIIGNLTIIGIPFQEEVICITIESREIANGFIEQFDLLWKIAKK